jgi:hypothetical protein
MTLPVAEFDVTYADLCTVDVPIAPSPESLRNAGRNVEDVERLKEKVRPVAMHQVRFDNASPFPITTAPAIVLRGGRLLGQGRTCYTSPGGKCDVTVTQAVGLRVAKEEHETGRKPDALRVDGNSYCRVDLAAEIRIANDTDTARDVEVTRYVMGAVDSADHEGEKAAVNALEDVDANSAQVWGWYDQRVNSAGRIRWKIRVEPRSTVTLAYAWHYFWR